MKSSASNQLFGHNIGAVGDNLCFWLGTNGPANGGTKRLVDGYGSGSVNSAGSYTQENGVRAVITVSKTKCT